MTTTATPNQIKFIQSLFGEVPNPVPECIDAAVTALLAPIVPLIGTAIGGGDISKSEASEVINVLKAVQRVTKSVVAPAKPKWVTEDNGATFMIVGAADVLVPGAIVEVFSRNGSRNVTIGEVVRTNGTVTYARPEARKTAAEVPEGVHFYDGQYVKVQVSKAGNLYGSNWTGSGWDHNGKAALKGLSVSTKLTAKQAAVFGHNTGHCVFCSRELTDDRSLTVGYGPICAERNGLPWGEA